jgi:hypothetical protein
MKDFLFIDLAQGDIDRPFDGMAHGQFRDMYGRQIAIGKADLREYVTNTLENLSATKTEAGELVGLPIDARGHDKGDSAGWIKMVSLSDSGDVVRFTPQWTDIGRDLIGSNVRRFFSPTLDLENKVILGGSLTNWPATRNEKGKILLRPIEMSEDIQTVDETETPFVFILDAVKSVVSDVVSGLLNKQPDNANLEREKPMGEENKNVELSGPEIELEISKRAEARAVELAQGMAVDMAAKIVADEKHKAHVAELSAELVGKGFPVTAEELQGFLSDLSEEAAQKAESILKAVTEKGLIDFSEAGHGREEHGNQPVPDWAKPILTAWLSSGNSMEEFFTANASELGVMSDYNLQEFVKEK